MGHQKSSDGESTGSERIGQGDDETDAETPTQGHHERDGPRKGTEAGESVSANPLQVPISVLSTTLLAISTDRTGFSTCENVSFRLGETLL